MWEISSVVLGDCEIAEVYSVNESGLSDYITTHDPQIFAHLVLILIADSGINFECLFD